MDKHRQRIEEIRTRLRSSAKVAFAPAAPPMDPAMAGGGMPPMDPAMMAAAAGGAPPMDPTMMGAPMPAPPMDPAMMGGAPPMDPSMMGGAGGMPVDPATMAQLQQMAEQMGLVGGGGGAPATQGDPALNEKVDAIGFLVLEIAKVLGIGDQGDGGMAPEQQEALPPEMAEEGVGGPQSMESVSGQNPEQDQVLSDAAQSEPVTKMAKVGEGNDSYIARQLAKMRR